MLDFPELDVPKLADAAGFVLMTRPGCDADTMARILLEADAIYVDCYDQGMYDGRMPDAVEETRRLARADIADLAASPFWTRLVEPGTLVLRQSIGPRDLGELSRADRWALSEACDRAAA